MEIPEATRKAEQDLIEDARHPGKRALRRALGRERRGQQVVAVVTAAASLPLGTAATGAQASAAPTIVAAKTVSDVGHAPGAPIVLTAAEQPAAPQSGRITNSQWRAALIHSARHQMALNPSRAGAWGEVGEGNNGPQCAEGVSLMVNGAEHATGAFWVSNPRVTAAYGEQQTWVIWRVSGDGSWQQWAQAHGRWHPIGDGYQPQAGDLGTYGDYHVVMMGGDGTVYGMDDSSDLGNHHRNAGGGFSGYIDMSLPSNLAASGGQANPNSGQPAHRKAPKPVQQQPAPAPSTQAQSAVLQSDNVPGGLAAPVVGNGGNGGTTQSSSATPLITPPVVAGGIAAPVFQVGTVGYADQFHADQPQQQSAQPVSQPKAQVPKKAAKPVRRYTRHNPPPAVRARIPGTAAQRAFIRSVVPGAIAAQHRWHVPASVTIAQAIDESGWGQSGLAARDHNLFGIKGTGPAGSDNLPTQEYQNGSYVTITAPFRVYHNDAESINDHGALLHNGAYGAALSAWARDHSNNGANAFANALTGVYATDPHYGPNLIAFMQKFNLYQFNKAPAPAQSAPASAPRSAPQPSNAGAGANIGRTGQQPQQSPVQNDAPGDVAVPGALAVGDAAPAPAQAGGLSAPGLPGNATLAAQVDGSGSGPDVQLAADVTPMPWLNPVPPQRQPGPPAPGNRMPWMSAPSAPPRNGSRPSAPRAPQAPVQATLMAARQPAVPQSRPAARSATSVDLVGVTPLSPRYGAKYVKSFKADAEDGANRAMYRAVSAATGVPWQIVATLALLRRPRGTEILTLEQLVRRFARLAWDGAHINVTGGRLNPRQLDAAYDAYGAKSQDGLKPSELTRLITVPLQGNRPM